MIKDKELRKFYFLLLIYIVLSILIFDPKLNTGGDNARYVILAESLSRFKGYLDLNLPGSPPHTQYPFGFPVLLVPFIWLFGKVFVVLKLIPFICGVGALVFFYLLMRRLLTDNWMYPILVFIFTPLLLEYNHWLFSEMPFIFFSLGALYFFSRYRESKKFFYLGALCAVFTYFIRTAGITLIVGITLALLYKREWSRLIIFAIIFLVPFVLWQYRSARIPQEWSYFHQLLSRDPYNPGLGTVSFGDMMNRIGTNFFLYLLTIFGLSLMPKLTGQFFFGLVGVIVLAAVIYGLIRRGKKLDVIDFYLIFSLGLLLLWPSVWSGDRFLLPLLPLLVFYLFYSLIIIFKRFKLRYGIMIATGVIIFLNLFSIVPSFGKGYRTRYPIDYERYFSVCSWAKNNLPKGAVVMARKPEFVYIISGHQAILYPFTFDRSKIEAKINEADYILLDNFMWTGTTRKYLWPVIEQQPERYSIVYQTPRPEFYLLKVVK